MGRQWGKQVGLPLSFFGPFYVLFKCLEKVFLCLCEEMCSCY